MKGISKGQESLVTNPFMKKFVNVRLMLFPNQLPFSYIGKPY